MTEIAETALERVEAINPVALFVEGGVDTICQYLEDQVDWDALDAADLETEEGRKEVRATSRSVARVKTRLNEKKKDLTASYKAKAKAIDKVGKQAWDFCEDLQSRITEKLDARTARIDAEIAEKARKRQEELEAKEKELEELRAREAAREAEDEWKAREEQIRKEATANSERRESELQEQIARDKQEARIRTERVKKAAIEAERQRVADERRAEELEKERQEEERLAREQDEAHRKAVDAEVLESLQTLGITTEYAEFFLEKLKEERIVRVRIDYSKDL